MMETFKQEYIKLALDYAEENRLGFEISPVSRADINKHVKKSNKLRDRLDQIFKIAKENDQLAEIVEFLKHENKYVRCLTAMYCLGTYTEKSVKVLKDLLLLPVPNHVGINAYTILHAFRRGYPTF